ncbi:MAG: homoserine dehydrogenase, partial [Clostridiales bacterium]|nr:homoserine dehydrogenase [Clostridiales bacterium]
VEATGVLGHITACFGEKGVSIRNIIQRDAGDDGRVPIVIITHTASEKAVKRALDSLDKSLAQLISLIRVEG